MALCLGGARFYVSAPFCLREKWHFGQVNCIIGREDQAGLTMFKAIGHALHCGHAINTASGARLEFFILSHPVRSCDFALMSNSRPACAHPTWHRRSVAVAAAYTGGGPRDDSTQQ